MNKAFLLFLIISTFSMARTEAQATYSYGINPYYGAVFRYKTGMPKLKFTHLHGMELFFNKQTNGSRFWETKYNYPKLGMSASYFSYGDPKELGNVYLASGYLDFTFSKKKQHQLRMNLGTGVVYSDVTYDQEKNPENKAIGASVSYILRGTIYYHYQVAPHWALNINFAFRHFSNGRMNMPNNGMNFPVAGVGLEYSPKDMPPFQKADEEEYNDDIHFNLFGATAWREVHYEDYKHKAYTLSAYFSKRVTWYNAILVGADAFSYSSASIQKHLSVDGIKLEQAEIDGRQAAFTVGNALYFGKLSLLVQAGLYMYDPHKVWSRWYQRYALKYPVTKNAFLQVSLKSHTRTANMIEWGAGFSL
jgi:hypothetical protein